MKPLISQYILMRSVIVPLIPSLIHVGDWDEDRPTQVAAHFPGLF